MKEDVCLYSTALFNTLGPKFAMDANEVVHAGGFKVQTQVTQKSECRLSKRTMNISDHYGRGEAQTC